ncbi:MAG: dolichyl-phosphate mannose synthase [Oribacterium sp.]|nr:dolichyl-phosphate mannose synthase [Oribacterium sp.]
MKKIHLIMPMGGGGTRFGNKGFNLPKPLIDLQGKPFFFWATQSITKFVDVQDITFVVLQEHIDKFDIKNKVLQYYSNAQFQVIPHVLNGAVLTCSEGVKLINDDLPILFNDCDHAFICDSFYHFCKEADFNNVDGALLTFRSDSPAFSYAIFDENHNVTGTIEKQVASDEAICGAYYFRNKNIFNTAVEKYLVNCDYKEFFVSGVYNVMGERGDKITTFGIDEHITFGTPDEYDMALNDARLSELL